MFPDGVEQRSSTSLEVVPGHRGPGYRASLFLLEKSVGFDGWHGF